MYKAKQNISTGTQDFISGNIYSAEEVGDADLSNFDLVGDEKKIPIAADTDQSASNGQTDSASTGEALE